MTPRRAQYLAWTALIAAFTTHLAPPAARAGGLASAASFGDRDILLCEHVRKGRFRQGCRLGRWTYKVCLAVPAEASERGDTLVLSQLEPALLDAWLPKLRLRLAWTGGSRCSQPAHTPGPLRVLVGGVEVGEVRVGDAGADFPLFADLNAPISWASRGASAGAPGHHVEVEVALEPVPSEADARLARAPVPHGCAVEVVEAAVQRDTLRLATAFAREEEAYRRAEGALQRLNLAILAVNNDASRARCLLQQMLDAVRVRAEAESGGPLAWAEMPEHARIEAQQILAQATAAGVLDGGPHGMAEFDLVSSWHAEGLLLPVDPCEDSSPDGHAMLISSLCSGSAPAEPSTADLCAAHAAEAEAMGRHARTMASLRELLTRTEAG